ncbi:MAG TPA: protease pro-enzyme activation domain-containing protein, partial [Conexibacter sp.]|nr:protease pro-enzyme activation domain-containing protein [Conexibacter sp.]
MSTAAGPGMPPGYERLTGSERTPRPGYRAVGPAPGDEPVRVVVKVRPRAPLPDPVRLAAVRPSQRPAPATHDGHAAAHGAAQADMEAVLGFAHEHGLTVEEADPDARLIVLTGTVERMSAAFHTRLERYESEDPDVHRSYRGRVGHVHVPAHLEPVITSLSGLDDRRQVRPRPLAAHTAPEVQYTPIDLAQIYAFPPRLDGSGQTIGLLEFGGGYRDADLDEFFTQMRLPRPRVTPVSVDGTPNAPGNPDADGEVVLDITIAGGMAPGAAIVVYFAQFTEAGWVEALTKAIHDTHRRPSVISISWGWSELEGDTEFAWTPQALREVDTVLKEAANLG